MPASYSEICWRRWAGGRIPPRPGRAARRPGQAEVDQHGVPSPRCGTSFWLDVEMDDVLAVPYAHGGGANRPGDSAVAMAQAAMSAGRALRCVPRPGTLGSPLAARAHIRSLDTAEDLSYLKRQAADGCGLNWHFIRSGRPGRTRRLTDSVEQSHAASCGAPDAAAHRRSRRENGCPRFIVLWSPAVAQASQHQIFSPLRHHKAAEVVSVPAAES
jgi:hypothetical protein